MRNQQKSECDQESKRRNREESKRRNRELFELVWTIFLSIITSVITTLLLYKK